MITIGVELNHVVRNINKQILKYYEKEYEKGLDVEEIDTNEDVFKYVKFNSKKENNQFFYIDFPYEIFGCAETTERFLAVSITNWLVDISDIEEEDIRVIFYSLNEDALTIQSTYFLSKIGARVRKMIFPRNIGELWEECDVVVTANREILESEIPQGKKVVLINRPFNSDVKEKAYANYNTLNALIGDNNFIKRLIEDAKEKNS